MSSRRACSHVIEPISGAAMPRTSCARPGGCGGQPMSRSDPLLMLADIARLTCETPGSRRRGRPRDLPASGPDGRPSADASPGARVHRPPDVAPRRRDDPGDPRPAAGDEGPQAASGAPDGHPRTAGRPGWTHELFWTRYRDAVGRTERPTPTPRSPPTSRCSTASSGPSPTTCASSSSGSDCRRHSVRHPDGRPDETRDFVRPTLE